ncbi:hypothetical protein HZS_940, partial [Henneguya salminicola]
MVNRIKDYCSEWEQASRNMTEIYIENKREKILLIIGLLVEEHNIGFAKKAFHGGPLGELVQWTDTIASLFTLNYDITLYIDRSDLLNVDPFKYNIIFIDYIGLEILYRLHPMFKKDPLITCKFRVVDSFGTESEFNLGLSECGYCGY